MLAWAEYQVSCLRCGHVHDEPVEWLLGHREVICPGCCATICVKFSELSVVASSLGGREVLNLSLWSPRKTRGGPKSRKAVAPAAGSDGACTAEKPTSVAS